VRRSYLSLFFDNAPKHLIGTMMLILGLALGLLSTGIAYLLWARGEEAHHRQGIALVEAFLDAMEREDYEEAWKHAHPYWFMFDEPGELRNDFGRLFRFLGERQSIEPFMANTFIDPHGEPCMVLIMALDYENEYTHATFRLYQHPIHNRWALAFFSVPTIFWRPPDHILFPDEANEADE